MAYFDFLIDKTNLAPDANQKYLYNLDTVWRPGELESITVPQAELIAINVCRLESGGFSFNLERMEGKFRCNYGCAFIEMTDENLKRFDHYRDASAAAWAASSYAKEQRRKVKDLDGKP